jgi:hypothetical protein
MSTTNFPTSFPTVKNYAARVDDLTDFCLGEYRVDPMEMRIITACLLPAPPHTSIKLICDSSRAEFWFQLHRALRIICLREVYDIPFLRVTRPRYANLKIDEILQASTSPMIALDRLFQEQAAKPHQRSEYPAFEAECVRLRVRSSWDTVANPKSQAELVRLLKLVLDLEHRKAYPRPFATPSEMMKYGVRLLTVLNPALTSPQSTFHNLRMLVSAHAVMQDRFIADESDWQAVNRVAMDTIRPWTREILTVFSEKSGYISEKDLALYSGVALGVVKRECARLEKENVLERTRFKRMLAVKPGLGDDVMKLVKGEWEWAGNARGSGQGNER